MTVTLALPGMRVQAAVSANIVRFPVGHPGAEATAIEQYDANHAAALAIDGDKTKDWAPNGHAVGDWWRATWGALVTVDRVKLYPRDGSCDNFGFGRIRFSDSTYVSFDLRGMTSSSVAATIDFAPKQRLAWMEVVTDGGAGTCHPGLAEVEAFNTQVSTTANILRPPPATAYSASSVYSSTYSAAKAADGSTSSEWAGLGYSVGAWWRVDWTTPQKLDRVKLVPRAAACDTYGYGTIHFSDSSTVSFDIRAYTKSNPLTLDFTPRSAITWMKVVSDGGGGSCNPGFTEVEAFDTASPPRASAPDLDIASDTPFLHDVEGTAVLRPAADALVSATTFSTGTTGWNLLDEDVLDVNDWVKPGNGGYAFLSFTTSGFEPSTVISRVTVRANIVNPAIAASASIAVRRPTDDETAIEHINYRHAFNSGFSDVSRFSEGTTAREIKTYVEEALRYGRVREDGASVVQDLGRTIGYDRAGNVVSGIEVWIRDGFIRTAYPVAP